MNILNISAFLEHGALLTPDAPYLLMQGQKISYAEVDRQARQFANVLKGLKIEKGDKVALMLPNIPSFVAATYGTLKAGAVTVPLSVLSPGPEVAHFLKDSEARALVVFEPFFEAASAGFGQVDTCEHLILVNAPNSEAEPAGVKRFSALMKSADTAFETIATAPDDACAILYTSGTTGFPKGAVLTHLNYHYFVSLLTHDIWDLHRSDVISLIAPVFHIFGQTLVHVASAAKAKLSLVPQIDMALFLKLMEQDKVTFFAGVPMLATFLLHSPLTKDHDLSSLKKVVFGGAPIAAAVFEQFKERFGVELFAGYAMTEGVPFAFLTPDMEDAPYDSVGKPVQGIDVQIVDEDGNQLPEGETGEIVVRGPQVFEGYYKQDKENKQAFRGGWFHTGDVGYFNEKGYLFLVDRLKDMIKHGGYSVFPAEIERVLGTHPAVQECAVVGTPHETLGERIVAFVVIKPESNISQKDLVAYSKKELASYKVPRVFEFRESLPKSAAGKILRRKLREELIENTA